jgi:SAM-dependent methyltransferase
MTGEGARVTGLDAQEAQIERARAAEPAGDEDYVVGLAEALPFATGEADVVVFFNSLHHVPPPAMAAALTEACRVLRPGGLLYVSEPVAEGPFFELVRPVDDETTVRRLAYDAVKAVKCFEQIEERSFLHPMVLADYEAFRDLIVSADNSRARLADALAAELRAGFEAAGMRTEKGWAFEMPTRVNLLRRGGA